MSAICNVKIQLSCLSTGRHFDFVAMPCPTKIAQRLNHGILQDAQADALILVCNCFICASPYWADSTDYWSRFYVRHKEYATRCLPYPISSRPLLQRHPVHIARTSIESMGSTLDTFLSCPVFRESEWMRKGLQFDSVPDFVKAE